MSDVDDFDGDGWGEDDDALDDLSLDDDDNDDDGGNPTPSTHVVAASAFGGTTTAADGWDNDSDGFDVSSRHDTEEEEVVGVVMAETTATPPVTTATTPTAAAVAMDTSATKKKDAIAAEGWDDDDDFDLSEAATYEQEDRILADPVVIASTATPITSPTTTNAADHADNAWADDNDDMEGLDSFSDQEDGDDAVAPTTEAPPLSPLCKQLEEYIASIPSHIRSANAVLAADYNETPQSALELRDYYTTRPKLYDYTVHTELDRMDYTLVTPDGDILTDTVDIRQCLVQNQPYYTPSQTVCIRAANQSLLADVLQVLTGPDRVVRSDYLAACTATACRFTVDLSSGTVHVQATLDLSLPTEHGRWTVAEGAALVSLECGDDTIRRPPSVEFRLVEWHTRTGPHDSQWRSKLEQCATLLDMLRDQDDGNHGGTMEEIQGEAPAHFRDRFLQSRWTAASDGMKSAWQDIDEATGFGTKLKAVSAAISLPDDVLEQARQAELEQAEAVLMQQQQQPQHRPTSILGGLFGSLAKSVALPEEDPELYQDWKSAPSESAASRPAGSPPSALPRLYNRPASPQPQQSKQEQPTAPKFYNEKTPEPPPVAAIPKFYNVVEKTEPPVKLYNSETPSAIPRLYNKATPPPPPPPHLESSTHSGAIPRLYNTETPPQPRVEPTHSGAIPKLYNAETPTKPLVEPTSSGAIPKLYNAETPPKPPASTAMTGGPGSEFVDQERSANASLGRQEGSGIDKSQSSPTAKDGWEDEEIFVDNDASTGNDTTKPYDPKTDIIPTRKRWINPRPGRRELGLF